MVAKVSFETSNVCRTTRKTVPFTATAFITSNLTTISLIYSFYPCSPAAQRRPWPPHSRGSYITHNDSPQSVGLFRTSDQLVAETST